MGSWAVSKVVLAMWRAWCQIIGRLPVRVCGVILTRQIGSVIRHGRGSNRLDRVITTSSTHLRAQKGNEGAVA